MLDRQLITKYRVADLAFAGLCTLLLGIFKGGLLYHMEQYSLDSILKCNA